MKTSLMLIGLVMVASSATAQRSPQTTEWREVNPVDIREWEVPWDRTRPRDPFVLDESRVWFVGQTGDYVGYLDRATNQFGKYDLADGAGPHNLIVDRNGYVWYAGNRQSHIGVLNPETGTIAKIMMPDSAARDPHTLVFDHEGDIWFTVQQGNFIGFLDTETRDVKLVSVPTPRARPYGIKIDSNNRPWIVLFGTNKIATVNPETMALEEFALPNEESRPRRMAITSDDKIYYTDYSRGFLGYFDPATKETREWANPGGAGSLPYGMEIDNQDRVWFVEGGILPNRFVGFDHATKTFFSQTKVPSLGGTIRHMMYYEPSQEIWFGTDTNYVGRVVVPR